MVFCILEYRKFLLSTASVVSACPFALITATLALPSAKTCKKRTNNTAFVCSSVSARSLWKRCNSGTPTEVSVNSNSVFFRSQSLINNMFGGPFLYFGVPVLGASATYFFVKLARSGFFDDVQVNRCIAQGWGSKRGKFPQNIHCSELGHFYNAINLNDFPVKTG